jgi:hypothetical protein
MKPHGRPDPRFDIDLPYGRQAELQIADYLTWLAEGNGRIEVKHKRRIDLLFYVETHHDPGRRGIYVPSGISTSTAAAWAFNISDTGIAVIFPSDEVRRMLTDPSSRDAQEHDGSCPTRGKLISLNVLVYRHKSAAKAKVPREMVSGRQ